MRSQRRGGGPPPPSNGRTWDLLRERRPLGLREIRSLERPPRTPEGIELAVGLVHGRPAALVATRQGGVEAVAWSIVALELARRSGPALEAWVFAPQISASMRELADWLSDYGVTARLAGVPALAERPGDLVSIEPQGERDLLARSLGGPSESVFDRVVRVAEGAAAVTTAGAVRLVEDGCVLYMRGTRILRITPESEGASVQLLEPERRQMHVHDGNFSRWGPELFEELVALAQDPRLLDAPGAARDALIQASADAAAAHVLARWLPWNEDGTDPADWIGVDGEGRLVVGLIRSSVGLPELAAIVCAAFRVDAERDRWAPGSTGALRIMLSGQVARDALPLLESLDLDVESRQDLVETAPEPEGERRGRRRSRRRRRGRGGDDAPERSEGRDDRDGPAAEGDELEAPDPLRATAAPPRRARGRWPDDETEPEEAPRRQARADRSDEAEEVETEVEPRSQDDEPAAFDEERRSGSAVAAPDDSEPKPSEPAEARASTPEAEEGEELEIAESLEYADLSEPVPEEETPAAPPPRRRRPKAAIAVRNDTDSIITALILARERRNVPFFYVCAQHQLMDFLRGKATDIDESTDLLLVGFTAQPVPSETIAAAAVYRGQISWIDHHDWPIEDVERLREAIGEDAVFLSDGSGSSLAAVVDMSERRSRFTDKLLDLSGRRLSENDMGKWGYNLIGLLQRMAGSSGDYRNEIQPVLAGKPSELPAVEDVYARELEWLQAHQPRLVCFGEYQMVVGHVPDGLDAGEIGRKLRLQTGARISLSSREGDPYVVVGYNEEKRHINVLGLLEQLEGKLPWLHSRSSGDRAGRVEIDELASHPERIEAMIGEIVRHKSVLYG